MNIISAQFSGSPKTYDYKIPGTGNDLLVAGDRVVVPTGLKKDLTVGMSIATVVSARKAIDGESTSHLTTVLAVVPAATIKESQKEAEWFAAEAAKTVDTNDGEAAAKAVLAK